MRSRSLAGLVVAVVTAGAFVACSEEPPVAPGAAHNAHNMAPVANLADIDTTPFTLRASLDSFRLIQRPDFRMISEARKDIVMQRLVFRGKGIWHTHPGPSFVFVVQGRLRLHRFLGASAGCTRTPFREGQAYFEIADQVHRVVVPEGEFTVVMVTRFNIPGNNAPFTIPADDPGC